MTTGKIITLNIGTSVEKMISLLFDYVVYVCHSFPSKEQVSLNFMAAVTIHSDFGAQEKKICHCFYFSPICMEVTGLNAMILVF